MSARPDLPPARGVRAATGPVHDTVVLAHHERAVRRRRLMTRGGEGVLLDLPALRTLAHGDALELEDGRLIGVVAADEDLWEVRGPDLARLAWHVGNRHAACEVRGDRLLVLRDHVLAAMLRGLGADLREVRGPFSPEGGAYSHGHAAETALPVHGT